MLKLNVIWSDKTDKTEMFLASRDVCVSNIFYEP